MYCISACQRSADPFINVKANLDPWFNLLTHIGKQEGFNSLSQIAKKFNSLSHIRKKSSIFLILFYDPRFNSSSHISLQKKVQFFESYSKKWVQFFEKGSMSVRHVEEKDSILCVMLKRRVQFFESCWKEGFNPASRVEKKDSILRIIFFRKN